MIAKYKEHYLEDVPENVQAWIRKILVAGGVQNANSVPLKMGDRWATYADSYITINKDHMNFLEQASAEPENYEKISCCIEYIVLHEGKHYNNADMDRGIFIYCLSCIPLLANLSFNNAIRFYNILSFALPVVSCVLYRRHQEAEADRFSFINCPSVEKLEIVKKCILESANIFESNLLYRPLQGQYNVFEKIVRPLISKKLNDLIKKQEAADCPYDEKQSIGRKKNHLIEFANFVHDWQHPSIRSRVDLAQECLDQKKTVLAG